MLRNSGRFLIAFWLAFSGSAGQVFEANLDLWTSRKIFVVVVALSQDYLERSTIAWEHASQQTFDDLETLWKGFFQ